MPAAKKKRYVIELGLSEYDAGVLTSEKETADYFEQLLQYEVNAKSAANWVMGPLKEIENALPAPGRVAEMILLVDNGKVNFSSAAQTILPALLVNNSGSAMEIAQEQNVLIDASAIDLDTIIDQVIAKYPDKVLEYQKGKKGLLGLFMGEVMKLSGGKINPGKTNTLLINKLDKQ